MATGKQHKMAILARMAAKGPRKERTRPEPRQDTVADLERARDRVSAAEQACRCRLRLEPSSHYGPKNFATFKNSTISVLNVSKSGLREAPITRG